MSNTAILSVLCQGSPNGPTDLDSYPPTLYSEPVGTVRDGLGYWNRECGSYAAYMVQRAGGDMLPRAQLWLPGYWARNVPPEYIVMVPQPGDVGVIPANLGLPNGHAIYISCVVPGTNNLLAKSYNTEDSGNFEVNVWAPSGSVGGVPFSFVFIRFPQVVSGDQ